MPDPLTGKKVVVLGAARQGTALAKWLRSIDAAVIVSDMRSPEQLQEAAQELNGLGIQFALGGHPLSLLEGADVLCVSGGVPLETPIVQEAYRRGVRVTNDAQLFIERCPCHVVGITGSAGKTTTTTLVGQILEAAGMLPWVGGNIGNPLISDLPYIKPSDIAVMELSSFQLELMTTSPHVAAVLNITPNHLDRHGTMENYTNAKARILEFQVVGDYAVLGRDDAAASSLAGRVQHELAYFSGRAAVDVGAWLAGDRVMCRPRFLDSIEAVCSIDEIPLRGYHNVLNVLAACAVSGCAGAPVEAMRRAILKFKPVEHRLEFVRAWQGVSFYNDSIATAPERVIAAINAFNEPLVLLLGGRDKKLPWADLLKLAAGRARAVVAFGEHGLSIAQQAAEASAAAGGRLMVEQAAGLEEAVRAAANLARPGDVVLLSPGCTSYDAYEDFAERGQHFKQLVKGL